MEDKEKLLAAMAVLDGARWNDSDFQNVGASFQFNDDDDFWGCLVSFDHGLPGRMKRYEMPVSMAEGGEVEIEAGEDSHIGNDAAAVWMWLYYEELLRDEPET